MSLGALRLAVIINRQEEAVIAICMNHIQEAVHHIAVRHTAINHTAVLLRAVQAVITAINQILQTNHHIAVVLKRTQPPAGVHMTLMMMVMMISIWTAIMTVTDTTGIAIRRMV